MQIRYFAPEVIVDTVTTYAEKVGLPFSQVVSDLLAEETGYSQPGRPAPLVQIPRPKSFKPDPVPGACATLKCRVPIEVEARINAMARKEGIPAGRGKEARNTMITRLLARRLGFAITSNDGDARDSSQQLLLTG